jgi:hypothetical protein
MWLLLDKLVVLANPFTHRFNACQQRLQRGLPLGAQSLGFFPDSCYARYSRVADQPHVPLLRHDHFVPQLAEQAAHPRRVHARFQRDPAARHSAKHFAQGLRSRA